MTVGKRSSSKIYFDILLVLCEELKNDKPSLTRVAQKANLPYDRFQKRLNQLIQLGLVSRGQDQKLSVTEKGLEFIAEYMKITDFLRKIGLLL